MPPVDNSLPTVVLYTRGGGRLNRVATIRMLPFTPWPEIVVWGERTFVRTSPDTEEVPVYVEGMAWWVPSDMWVDPTWEQCHPAIVDAPPIKDPAA